VLAIAGVLLSVAIPSMRSMTLNNAIVSCRDSLAGAIKMARSEAVNTQSVVTICPSVNQSGCGGDWADGWIVFADDDESGTRNNSSERLVDVDTCSNNVGIGNGAALAGISFSAIGINLGNAATIGICDSEATEGINGRAILLTATGALSYSSVAADANCPTP